MTTDLSGMSKRRILFIDDEPNVLEAFRRLLGTQRTNWDMFFVQSAREGLQELEKAPFDAIVSDVQMPGMTGLELLEHLASSEHTRDIPVIIVTGSHEAALKRRALDLGAAD